MKQQTFSDIEYSNRKRKTKREEFLEIMDEIIPWDEWVGVIQPFYPGGKRGRPPKGIEKMLRMYLLQVWFNLSDEGHMILVQVMLQPVYIPVRVICWGALRAGWTGESGRAGRGAEPHVRPPQPEEIDR